MTSRSVWLQARVAPEVLAQVDAHAAEGFSRSAWLRALVAWAISSGWQPGQGWKRQWVPSGGQGAGVQASTFPATIVPPAGPGHDLSRMDVARQALATAQAKTGVAELAAVPFEEEP